MLAAAIPAIVLFVVTTLTKVATGWYAAGRVGAAPKGRLRAGTVLIARGEFSIVIAALGSGLVDGPDLGALAAGYVLITAMVGPIVAKFADSIPLPTRLMRQEPNGLRSNARRSDLEHRVIRRCSEEFDIGAVGPTPSKNWPTSHFQRRR